MKLLESSELPTKAQRSHHGQHGRGVLASLLLLLLEPQALQLVGKITLLSHHGRGVLLKGLGDGVPGRLCVGWQVGSQGGAVAALQHAAPQSVGAQVDRVDHGNEGEVVVLSRQVQHALQLPVRRQVPCGPVILREQQVVRVGAQYQQAWSAGPSTAGGPAQGLQLCLQTSWEIVPAVPLPVLCPPGLIVWSQAHLEVGEVSHTFSRTVFFVQEGSERFRETRAGCIGEDLVFVSGTSWWVT